MATGDGHWRWRLASLWLTQKIDQESFWGIHGINQFGGGLPSRSAEGTKSGAGRRALKMLVNNRCPRFEKRPRKRRVAPKN